MIEKKSKNFLQIAAKQTFVAQFDRAHVRRLGKTMSYNKAALLPKEEYQTLQNIS